MVIVVLGLHMAMRNVFFAGVLWFRSGERFTCCREHFGLVGVTFSCYEHALFQVHVGSRVVAWIQARGCERIVV